MIRLAILGLSSTDAALIASAISVAIAGAATFISARALRYTGKTFDITLEQHRAYLAEAQRTPDFEIEIRWHHGETDKVVDATITAGRVILKITNTGEKLGANAVINLLLPTAYAQSVDVLGKQIESFKSEESLPSESGGLDTTLISWTQDVFPAKLAMFTEVRFDLSRVSASIPLKAVVICDGKAWQNSAVLRVLTAEDL